MITQRTQVRMAYIAPHMTPLDQGYAATLQQYQHGLMGQGGRAAGVIGQTAMGQLYQTFRQQAAVLAYTDIFGVCAILAFCVVPLTLFLSNKKGGGPAGAH